MAVWLTPERGVSIEAGVRVSEWQPRLPVSREII